LPSDCSASGSSCSVSLAAISGPPSNQRQSKPRYHRRMEKPLRIGVLAVQGNFREHAAMLRRLGAEPLEVRLPEQLDGLDGLIIPGGESTAIGRLMRLYGLDEAVREFAGPIFGTCAGMIVLDRDHLGIGDYRTRRNAFGRQVRSFEADLDVGDGDEPLRAVFSRAPWLEA